MSFGSKIKAKYEVVALGLELQVLTKANKAGMQLGGKLRSEIKILDDKERNKQIMLKFKEFKKDNKISDKIQDAAIARAFLKGFRVAFLDE